MQDIKKAGDDLGANDYNMAHIMPISLIDGSVVDTRPTLISLGFLGDSNKICVDPLVINNMIYNLTNHGEIQMGIISESIKKVNIGAQNVSLNVSYRQAKLLEDFNGFLDKKLGFVYTLIVGVFKPFAETLFYYVAPLKSLTNTIDMILSRLTQVSGVPGISDIYTAIKNFAYKQCDIINSCVAIGVSIEDLIISISKLHDDLEIQIPRLFQGTDEGVGQKDGMPWAIKRYSDILDANYKLLHEKFDNYLLTLEGAAKSLEATDSTLAKGIKSIDEMGINQTDTASCSYDLDKKLKDPDCIRSQNILISKKKQLDNNY